MNTVYLSPHLDDAVLSCGAAIHQQRAAGHRVLVITIFAGQPVASDLSPFALLQHQHWGNPARPAALRRAEDAAALTYLDSEALHLEYLDCVYRYGPDRRWLYTGEDALWAEPHPADPVAQDGARSLASRLVGILPAKEEAIVCAPLSVGHHVDHQIVHSAARRLMEIGYRVTFYEDYPYAEQPGKLETALTVIGGREWSVELIPLGVANVAAQVFALGYYRSQMSVLFGSAEAMPNRLWAFAASRSEEAQLAERIWHVPGTAGGVGAP